MFSIPIANWEEMNLNQTRRFDFAKTQVSSWRLTFAVNGMLIKSILMGSPQIEEVTDAVLLKCLYILLYINWIHCKTIVQGYPVGTMWFAPCLSQFQSGNDWLGMLEKGINSEAGLIFNIFPGVSRLLNDAQWPLHCHHGTYLQSDIPFSTRKQIEWRATDHKDMFVVGPVVHCLLDAI